MHAGSCAKTADDCEAGEPAQSTPGIAEHGRRDPHADEEAEGPHSEAEEEAEREETTEAPEAACIEAQESTMNTRKRNPRPKFPTGRLIKVEAIELTAGGRIKRVKIRDSELKKLKRKNPAKRKRAACKNTKRRKRARR